MLTRPILLPISIVRSPYQLFSSKYRRKPNSMNQSSSNVYDRLLVIVYTLSCTHGCYTTHLWCMWDTSGYVYYGWLNYRKFETHYRKFETFFRKFETFVENVPAACVESAQTFYTPSDCWVKVPIIRQIVGIIHDFVYFPNPKGGWGCGA